MKRKLLFGCVLITFIFMMVPSLSALEYNEIVAENESRLKDTLVYERIDALKSRLAHSLKRIENILNDDIWSILWDIINDIIGIIVIFITFNGIDLLFLLLIPLFVSIPLIAMMKVIELGVYGAILFDIARNIADLIMYIISPTNTSSPNY